MPISVEVLNEMADWQCPWCGFGVIYFRKGSCAENQKLFVEHIMADKDHMKKWRKLREYMSKYEVAIEQYAEGEQTLYECDIDIIQ